MKKFIKPILPFSILITMIPCQAQDIHFSQIFETPLYRNPALAGIVNADIRVQGVFRSQWNNFANAYMTGMLNAEYKLPAGKGDDFITLGLETFYDRAGTTDLTTTIVMPVFNYHKSISEARNMYLSLAFMGGFVNRRLDRSKVVTDNQFNGGTDGETLENVNYAYLDGSTGVSFNTGLGDDPGNNLVIGVGYHHFNKPNNSFYENENIMLDSKWVFSGDVRLKLREYSWITFYSNYSMQGKYREALAGLLYSFKLGPLLDEPRYTIHGGAMLRWQDAIVPVLKLDYSPFAFALSYDINISPLKNVSKGRGGVEFSVSYTGFTNKDNSSLNAVKCPRF